MLLGDTIGPPQPRGRTEADFHRELQDSSPYKAWHSAKARVRYGLPMTQWPTEIAEAWQSYAVMKALQVRQVTLSQLYGAPLALYGVQSAA